MADLGLMGMGGAAGAGDALATIFDQRLRAAAEQRAQQQQQIQQQEFQQNQQRLDASMRIAAQEKADTLAQHLKEQTLAHTKGLNDALTQLPQDTTLTAGTRDQLVQGGVLPERFQPTPITPQAPPASLAAPDQPPPGPLPGTVANSPAPAERSFQRIPTPAESQTAMDQAEQQRLIADPSTDPMVKRFLQLRRILPKGENAPADLFKDPAQAKNDREELIRLSASLRPPVAGPQPQMFTGPDGRTHAVQFSGGKATEIPLPNPDYAKPGGAADKPLPATTAENLAGINEAEVQGVKVLRQLKAEGLDKINNPADPRWEKFLVTTLKVAPGDFNKADIQQRTAYVNAVLTRGLMGGRPSQYVAQLIQQHMPQGEMTGEQLYHVMENVLQESAGRRGELEPLMGRKAGDLAPKTGETYQQFLNSLAGSDSAAGVKHYNPATGRVE